MKEIIEALQKMKDNPDDLTALPNVISQLQEVGNREEQYQERINKLQEINRSYLAQIPIPGNEPEEPEEKAPTLEDAKKYLIDTLGGNE